MDKIKIDESWKSVIGKEFQKDYMVGLKDFLASELKQNKTIYPHGQEIFSAFNETPFEKVKVVIIGQDPYHGPGQAHGMCFSVRPGIKVPPSLVNIYQELSSDLGVRPVTHGFLLNWARQGVLLLNNVLTVEKAKAASHKGRGWELFTDKVIQVLNDERENLVFLLWGTPAQKKASIVDENKHYVLRAPHPSPLSSYRGFFGCKHFSKANDYLISKGIAPINWSLPQNLQ
ncbi:MAG: uracil-DNA glycosylase [Halobacteriovoraceae bacterium]|nr:uracil-DNA glycosylase [Halobacteriovoraceae bacterium]